MNARFPAAVLMLSVLFAGAAHAVSLVSGPVIDPANNHTYYLLDQATWTDSQAFALTLGGNLATINDAAENDFVFQTFGQNRDLWIGFNDVQTEGTFTWISGESSPYTNWRVGQPDNFSTPPVNGEDYVLIYGNNLPFGGKWNDSANDPSIYSGFSFANEEADVQGVVELNFAVPAPAPLAGSLVLGGCLMAFAIRRKNAR